MPNTAARRRAIRRIIGLQKVGSQSELVAGLADAGFDVTQATVSRDLREIGAVKVRSASGRSVYSVRTGSVNGDEGTSIQSLRRLLAEFAETIVPTGNLVVVSTPPGAAQVVAGAVDRVGIDGVLGTVAGDDTVLVVAAEAKGGWRIAKQLEQLGAGQ